MTGVVLICALVLHFGEHASFPGRVQLVVEGAIRAHLPASGAQLRVEYRTSIPDPGGIPADAVLLVAESEVRQWTGNISLPVAVQADGVVLRRMIVPVTVRLFDSVLVAKRTLDKYAVVGPAEVEVRWMETTGRADDVVRDARELDGRRTTKILREGEIVRPHWLERMPDVRRQDAVTLVAITGGVTLSTPAIALDDGRIGESIRVRRQGSRRTLAGVIVNEHTVRLDIGEK